MGEPEKLFTSEVDMRTDLLVLDCDDVSSFRKISNRRHRAAEFLWRCRGAYAVRAPVRRGSLLPNHGGVGHCESRPRAVPSRN